MTSSTPLPEPRSAAFGMTQQLAHSEITIENATALFSQQLTSASTWKRGPYKLDDAVRKATSASPQDTAAIFLSQSPSAWFAYHLAYSAHAIHSDGSDDHEAKLAAFEQLSAADRTIVATRLAQVNVHNTVQSTVDRIVSSANSTKRRRLDDGRPSYFVPSTTIRSPSETQGGYTTNCQDMPGSTSAAEPAHTTTITPIGASSVSYISHPATERLPPIFPLYLCGAISKHKDTANLTMSFPADASGRIGCLMSLAISSNKVQQVARELFGTDLEIDGDIWYVIQENGARMLPGPELHLQGAQDQGISKLLGKSISSAIKGSPVRREEIREAILATSCVTLVITRLPQDGAVLNLNLEIGAGFRLKDALFD